VQTLPAKGHSGTQYKGSMNKQLIDMFKEGKGREDFCAHHNISEHTFTRWLKTYPDFKEAYEVAIPHAKVYYFGLARDHLIESFEGSKINTALFNRIVNVRFNLPEKKRLKIEGISRARTVEGRLKKILVAIENEEISADEASNLMNVIETCMKTKTLGELEQRLQQVEEAQHVGFDKKEFDEVPDQELKGDI